MRILQMSKTEDREPKRALGVPVLFDLSSCNSHRVLQSIPPLQGAIRKNGYRANLYFNPRLLIETTTWAGLKLEVTVSSIHALSWDATFAPADFGFVGKSSTSIHGPAGGAIPIG